MTQAHVIPPRRIQLTEGAWPLRGAASHEQLLDILAVLCSAEWTSYDDVAAKLGIDRAVVSSVACSYQSLWGHA